VVTLVNSFEGITSGTAVTDGNSGGASGDAFDAVAGTVVAQAGAAHIGSIGLRASLAASTDSYCAWNVSGTNHYVRTYFQVPPAGATHNMRLILGYTGATKNWEVRLTVTAHLLDILTGGSQRIFLGADGASGPLTPGDWYRAESRVHAGGAELRLYDAAGTLLDSGTWSGTPTPGTQVRFGLNNSSNATQTVDEDAVGYSDTDWLGAAAAANTPPTVDAGIPQTVEPWSTVTLTGSASDPDGTVTSRLWTQTSGTVVTLSGAATDIATFDAPASIAGETLGFEFAATDDDGAESTDTTTVTVLPVTERAVVGGVEVPLRMLGVTL
jgi:hypothetical protein